MLHLNQDLSNFCLLYLIVMFLECLLNPEVSFSPGPSPSPSTGTDWSHRNAPFSGFGWLPPHTWFTFLLSSHFLRTRGSFKASTGGRFSCALSTHGGETCSLWEPWGRAVVQRTGRCLFSWSSSASASTSCFECPVMTIAWMSSLIRRHELVMILWFLLTHCPKSAGWRIVLIQGGSLQSALENKATFFCLIALVQGFQRPGNLYQAIVCFSQILLLLDGFFLYILSLAHSSDTCCLLIFQRKEMKSS